MFTGGGVVGLDENERPPLDAPVKPPDDLYVPELNELVLLDELNELPPLDEWEELPPKDLPLPPPVERTLWPPPLPPPLPIIQPPLLYEVNLRHHPLLHLQVYPEDSLFHPAYRILLLSLPVLLTCRAAYRLHICA